MKLQKLRASGWLFCSPGKAGRSCRLLFTLSDGRCLRGVISSNEIAKKQLWMMIPGLQTGAPATLLPNLIHIEHSLKRPFDLAEGAKSADGQKIDIAAHVESDQASGKVKIAFSKLGWSPGYAGATNS